MVYAAWGFADIAAPAVVGRRHDRRLDNRRGFMGAMAATSSGLVLDR